jgi:hypothetical protein
MMPLQVIDIPNIALSRNPQVLAKYETIPEDVEIVYVVFSHILGYSNLTLHLLASLTHHLEAPLIRSNGKTRK